MFIPHITPILFYWTKHYDKKDFKIATGREHTTKNVCSKLYFTQEGKLLQGQCPCVRDKFHVYLIVLCRLLHGKMSQ